MLPILTSAESKAFDDYLITKCGIPSLVLMENAARGALSAIEDWLDELVSLDCLHGSTNRDLQLITVAALARLVIRMAVTLHYPNSAERAASRFLH